MKQLLFVISLVIIGGVASAQEDKLVQHYTVEELRLNSEQASAYLLADQVSLRSCEGSECPLITLLPIGTPLRVMEQGKPMTLNHVSSYWYKVKTNEHTGWLWGGFIATAYAGSHSDPTVKFVAGYEKMEEEEGWMRTYYQIRAFRDGKELSKLSVLSFGRSIAEFTNYGNLGVKKVDDIITLRVPCEGGCGCSTGQIFVFWNGKELTHVMDAGGTADAEYSESEGLLFPCDMEGEAPYIMKYSDHVRWGEEWEEEQEIDEVPRIYTYEYFIWNGDSLVAADKKPRIYKTD
ncbi:MAG: hypothetical protein ACPGED_11320 [Flavobacteriales bacterium]